MSRVNCNGVHAELVDGFIVRSTSATPVSNAGVIGISMLKGNLDEHAVEVISQLRSCQEYEKSKTSLHISETDAKLHWCFQATINAFDDGKLSKITSIFITALEINISEKEIDHLQEDLQEDLHKAIQQILKRPLKMAPAIKVDGVVPNASVATSANAVAPPESRRSRTSCLT
jgi:hypothetical protein